MQSLCVAEEVVTLFKEERKKRRKDTHSIHQN
jgi:hypothetical protein